jgi:hypothetical protein
LASLLLSLWTKKASASSQTQLPFSNHKVAVGTEPLLIRDFNKLAP